MDRNPASTAPIRIVSCQPVYDPGCHCAFTDITCWHGPDASGRVWLACREAAGHSVHPSSQIVVMASADWGRSFAVQARIAARGIDVRDPHFYVVDDRLHIVIPGWSLPRERDKRGTLLARSETGLDWEVISEVPNFNPFTVWRPRRSTAPLGLVRK